MRTTTHTARTTTAIATALTILGSAAPTIAQGPETDPQTWYTSVRAELVAMLGERLETARANMAREEVPAGQQALLIAAAEDAFRGTIANLDAEIDAIEDRIRLQRAEQAPQEDHFCRADIAAGRLLERVGEDPADAHDALFAGVQCRTAYRGATSRPTTEEIESLRHLCFIARDRIVEHHDNSEIVFEPNRAAVYAVEQCAAYRGATWVAYTLTGSGRGVWSEADQTVRRLTNSFLRGEFSGP